MQVKTRFVAMLSLALTLALMPAVTGSAARADTILETFETKGSFNVWVSAIVAAGLSESLSRDGPYTVFAPTDEAFSRLPKGSVEALLRPENRAQLLRLVKYHLVRGRFEANRLDGRLTRIETLQGDEIYVEGRLEALLVDAAEAVETDIESSNGVIHAIDAVILPQW
jgi:uncharacterized surface protein with fasciclin (FAS1) repeats